MSTSVSSDTPRLRFGDGLRTLARGAHLLVRRPALVRWLVFPLFLTLVIDAIALYFGYGLLSDLFQGWLPSGEEGLTATLLAVMARFAAGLAVAVAITLSFSVTYLTVAGPFQEWMSREVEEVSRGAATPEPEGLVNLLRGISDGLRQALLLGLASLPIFVMGFIPLAGPLIILAWQSVILGYTFFEVAANRRLMPFIDKRTMARRHLGAVVGMGLPMALVAFIPILHLALLPVYVTAGTLLFLEALEREGRAPAPNQLPGQ